MTLPCAKESVMTAHKACHDVSPDYEPLSDHEQFWFFCGGPECQNYVRFESSGWWD